MIEFDNDNALNSSNDLHFKAIKFNDKLIISKELLGKNKARINITYLTSG